MAEPNSPFDSGIARTIEELDRTPLTNDRAQMFERTIAEAANYRDRNQVQDTAVGILDTLQSIGSIPLAVLPNYELADAARNSQILDQLRSAAYLQERKDDAAAVQQATEEGGEFAGLLEGAKRAATGGNTFADVMAQSPYLMIGPAARAMGFAAAATVPGVVGRGLAAVGGTTQGAIINRVAALSGVLEGAGSYGQTYEKILRETGDVEEATRQANIAGSTALAAGLLLGKTTPGFELDPTGLAKRSTANQFLSTAIRPTAGAVVGEVIEEGGMAITNTVTDNVLNNRDLLEGVGGAVGEAAAISAMFTGGMRAPGLIRDTSVAVGKGVTQGLAALSSGIAARATTPEQASADAATEILNEVVPPTDVAAPSTTDNIDATSDNTASNAAREQPEFELDGNAPPILRRGRPKSNSPAVENVLLNAQYELAIDQKEEGSAEEAALIASQEEFAPDVEQATAAIEELTPEAVAERVEKKDEQSQLLVEAVRLTDVTKLPESELSEDEKAIASVIREMADTRVDATAQQIFETGFAGKVGSRGIRGFLQTMLNYGRLIGDKPNEGSQNLLRFVGVLQERADLFRQALSQMNDGTVLQKDERGYPYIDVIGSKTLDKEGNLTDKPFRIWTNLANSVSTAERVIQDADRASGALENARKRFPGMFPTAKAPVVTPPAVTASAAPTPTPAAAVVTPAVDEGELSLADEAAPVDRTVPDLEANARQEEGRYKDQPKQPNSTRIEDEKGLIDIDMTGDTWIGTNNYSNPKKAEKGDGLERLKMALRMAKAAGKKYNSDQSLSGSALGMYMKAIREGVITATSRVSDKDLETALAGRNGIRTTDSATIDPENSVFQDVQLVETVTERRRDSARRRAVEELSPAEKDAEIQRLRDAVDNPVDTVTGLIRADTADEANNTPLQRALNEAIVESETSDIHWVSFDIANLGGLNEALNNVAEDANVHLRALIDIATSVFESFSDSDVVVRRRLRTGGDEFGMVVRSSNPLLAAAIQQINERVAAYTQVNNLDQIPNPKGKAPGLRLHIGSTQIVPGDTVGTIRNRADRQLDVSKKRNANVGREQTETPREVTRNEGSEEDRGTGNETRSGVRRTAQKAPAKARPVKPHKNAKLLSRIAREPAEILKAMVEFALWEQRGGGIIRESEDYKSPVIGRLPWLPSVWWWSEIPRKQNGKPFIPLEKSKETVAKAVRIAEAVRTTGRSSETLGPNQEALVNALLDLIEAEQASRQQELDLTEAAPTAEVAAIMETPDPTPDVAEQAESREEGPPTLSDEEMDSLMDSAEQVEDDSWFEAEQVSATTEETEAEQATNPLTLAPLAEGQSWVNPDFLSAFRLDPIKSVFAMMAKLRKAAPKDAAYLDLFATNLRPVIDKVFADGIAKKKLSDPDRLKEFLSRPYGVFVQALVRNADGSLEVHPAIREALTYAALLQVHRAPTQYDESTLIDQKTGLPVRAAQAHAWARNIARDTALLLGMKPGNEDSEAITQGVLLSLSLSAVQALVDNGDASLQKMRAINGQEYNLLTTTKAVLDTLDVHPAMVDNVAKITGGPRSYTASTTPSTNIPERVNHSSTKLSDSQKTSTQNLNNVPHYLNPLMMRMLEIMGQAGINRLLMGTVLRDDMPKVVKDYLKAKATGIRNELRAVNHYQKMLGEALSDPLFWEYGVDSNSRASSYMGPQGYTLLRDLFSSAKATISLKNAIHVEKTELAIAQALGIKLDQTPEQIKKEYRQKVTELGETAKTLVQSIKNGEDFTTLLERGTPLKPRELAGMLTLGELLLAQAAGETQLTTYLPIEVDGKTNGAVNAELLYGLGGTVSEANLEQGGVFLNTGETTWGERISYIIEKFKQKDLYLRVADAAVPIFNKIRSDQLLDAGEVDLADVKANQAIINTLLIATDMLNSEGTAFLREAAKRASNPTVYGAGKTGVASQLIADMRSNLVGKWIALDYQKNRSTDSKEVAKLQIEMNRLEGLLSMNEQMWEQAAFAAGEALLEAYKIQKPNVTRVTELMVKLTTFGFALKLAQWAGMQDAALKEAPRNANIPEKNSKGQTSRKWPLSRKQYQEILKNTFSMRFSTSANEEAVNLDDAENDPSAFRVEGLGTSLSAALDLPQPSNPGVSVLALTTIGAGDASMGNIFLQVFRQITNVWDGIEFIPTEADELSVELNQAAWEAVNYDVLADFESLATVLRQRLSTLTPDMQERVLEAYNSLVPEKQKLATFFGDPLITIAGDEAPSLFNEVADLERKLINEHKAQQEGLAKLKATPIHFIQMANGKGYTPPIETRDATASPDNRAGWNDTIDSTFQMLGDKADRRSVISMLDGVKWNRVQAYVWNRLKPLIPAGLTVTFARNAEQWQEATGKNDYGRVNGRTFIDGDRIVLATAAPSIILHEVMHATLTKLISNYTLNPASVPVGVRTAVNNLVQMLPTFRALKDPRLSVVQGQIWKLQDVWGDTAAAVDEMMTYVLTDPVVMKAVSPSFVKRLTTRIKEVFWSFLGKEVPGSFLDDVLKNFTALTNDLITENMGGYVASTSRDAVNPLDALSLRAFNKLAQIVARRPNMRSQVGNILADSLVNTVKTQYSLSADQNDLYNRVFTLLRLNARKGELEQFVSTALPKHPQANLFNGAIDLTASVMALAAVEPTFAAQLEQIYRQERGETSLVDTLIDKVLNDNQHLRVEEMLTETLNAIVADSEYELSKLGLVTQRLDRLGSKGLEMIGEKAEEWAENAPRGVSDFLKGINALTTENGAEAFGRGLMAYMNTATNSQALQSLMGALVGSQNDTNAVYRQVKRFKSVLARTRSEFTIVLPKVLKNLFPEGFDGWNTLYEHFARLGVEVLGTDAALMFTNDEARRRMITALESKVPNKWDAQNLAHYMVHGELPANTPHALLRNARAIADNLNGTPVTASEELVTDVDQLVTLYAIEALSEVERNRVKRIFLAHPSQMENLIGMLQKVREEESRQLRDQYRYTYWKGELPLTTDARHSIVIAGKVQGAKLEQLGYQRGDKYKQSAGDPQSDLYYYTRPFAPPPVFAQGIIATVQQTSKGINYTTAATITPEVGTMITNRRLIDYIQRNQGTASKLIPIHNFKGQVVGYERMLDRKKVREYTSSNNTLLHISIGQKLGRILEERWANTFNQQAIQILVNQWEDGKTRGIQDQYESVNSTTNKQIARAWEVVPGHIKKQLEDAFNGSVMIRRDLIENTIGYHNAGVGDVFTGDASLSDTTRKVMMGIAQTIFMGPRAAQILYASEAAIKEGVATARDWIIVRSMSVAYNNFMASINLVLANGVPIKDVIRYYRQGMQDVRVYSRLQNENIELMVKIAAAEGTEKTRLQTLQKGKLAAMKRLSIYPLVEAGELSDLPEGLIESPDNTYLGDFSGWLNKKLSVIHPKMPMIAANIAIAKDSQFHDTLSKAIQAGDFLARYAVFQHMVNTGQGIENARDTVRDEFVAYAINPGRARSYAENMGLVHWTQFTIRAQKVLLNRIRKNPFSFFVSQMGSTVTGTDGPLEMAITERGWDNSTGLDQTFGAPSAHIYSKLL